ncbi:MAG: hypothetical protein R3D34_06960 [Nitratireductor sp.]
MAGKACNPDQAWFPFRVPVPDTDQASAFFAVSREMERMPGKLGTMQWRTSFVWKNTGTFKESIRTGRKTRARELLIRTSFSSTVFDIAVKTKQR